MKTTTTQFIFILIITTIVGCGTPSSNDENEQNYIEIEGFENFPNSYFLDLNFVEFDKSELKLRNHNFEIKNNLFIAEKDSIIIDVNTEDKEVITYLNSRAYLNQTKSMFELFKTKSDSLIGDSQLAEMWYKKEGFKLFYFANASQIRLEFKAL